MYLYIGRYTYITNKKVAINLVLVRDESYKNDSTENSGKKISSVMVYNLLYIFKYTSSYISYTVQNCTYYKILNINF